MGSLKHFSRVVLTTTLGNNFYMQIRDSIAEKPIFVNMFENIHDNVTNMVSRCRFLG